MHPGAVRDARARAAHASAGPLAPPARARVRCACIDRGRQIEARLRPQPRPFLQRSYRPPGRASTPAFPGLGQGACALAEARCIIQRRGLDRADMHPHLRSAIAPSSRGSEKKTSENKLSTKRTGLRGAVEEAKRKNHGAEGRNGPETDRTRA